MDPLPKPCPHSDSDLARLIRISERTKAGLDRARRDGVILGRPRVIVNPAQIRELRGRGLSWGAISRETGFARGTCQKALAESV
jgi:DNA invertase Pin-like site-specific DNA recombinase